MAYLDYVLMIIGAQNLLMSVFIAKRNDLEIIQKAVQIIIIWLIPIFGATGLWLFYRSQDQESIHTSKRPFGGGSAGNSGMGSGD
ncbi:hypothetical protein L1286_21935 [Pseudoalteromonas sp. SMS1]|uniref:hypothetical protein n=1 Tax=Pseudoalteromonas sp. SMS1 TaxID=2908894 RepID=UPI001F43F9FE|nr:hypothetical protein [Pseudoalteromonas sp. SMS1]MCF2860146.1 hypothetical protein [Pseudoalteromonas sp. SMS1]